MEFSDIISLLPYGPSFLFVDELLDADENGISGTYTFRKEAAFYQDHFPENPVTPGVMLIETMAQIGLVCFGVFLLKDKIKAMPRFAFTGSQVEFFKPVLPGEQVRVISKKIYFRLGKLKCAVEMYNNASELICKGELSGMMV